MSEKTGNNFIIRSGETELVVQKHPNTVIVAVHTLWSLDVSVIEITLEQAKDLVKFLEDDREEN